MNRPEAPYPWGSRPFGSSAEGLLQINLPPQRKDPLAETAPFAKTGEMTTPTHRRLPRALLEARKSSNLSQKDVALAVRVDQSRLCALEKGRSVLTDLALEERLLVALNCSAQTSVAIRRAASHDRAMLALESHNLHPQAMELVSASLWLASHLDVQESTGLLSLLNEISRSKASIASFLGTDVARQHPVRLP